MGFLRKASLCSLRFTAWFYLWPGKEMSSLRGRLRQTQPLRSGPWVWLGLCWEEPVPGGGDTTTTGGLLPFRDARRPERVPGCSRRAKHPSGSPQRGNPSAMETGHT